jgi:predicted ATPase
MASRIFSSGRWSPSSARWGSMLRGRRQERDALDRRLQRVRLGESSVLLVRGEAGVGKTALLEYLAEQSTGCRIVRVRGV